jgi:Fe-S oxidoreductase
METYCILRSMGYDYGRYFGEITLTHDLTTLPDERRWQLAPPGPDAQPHRIVLYLGCNVLRTSHMVQTVTAIFDRLGLDYVAVGGPAYCCGIQHHNNGDDAAAGGMNRRTLEHFQRFQPEEVVLWCPSCLYFYDEVQHVEWPFPVRHVTEFLVDRLPDLMGGPDMAPQSPQRSEASRQSRGAPRQPVNRTLALHYHAASEPRRREGLAGRRLLEAVPGLRLVELAPEPRFGRLCTAAVQAQLGQDVWNDLVRREIDAALAGGADTFATIYHGCQRLICGFEAGRPIAIEHYLSVFARALGIDFEDKYKRYLLAGDPEQVLIETTPCQQANHVDPDKARALVMATFSARRPARDTDSPPS